MGFLSRVLWCWLTLVLATPVWVVEASLAHRGTAPSLAVLADWERKPATLGGSFCAYDWANRLTSGPGVTSIVYDAEGNRIKKVAGGTTTWYLVATVNPTGYPQVVEEFTGSSPGTSTLSRVYGYGLDLLHQRQMPGNTPNFYGYDGQGSVRFLVSTNGTITDKYVYDSYGNLIPGSSSIVNTNAYRYTGEQWDADLGMYYLRARYYQPSVGRFWTRDTYEGDSSDPLSLHRYLYTQGNPVNLIDPSGLTAGTMGDEMAGISGGQSIQGAGFGGFAGAVGGARGVAGLLGVAAGSSMATEFTLSRLQDWINEAGVVWRQKNPNRSVPKIVPIPASLIPTVALHIQMAQGTGRPSVLTRAPIGRNIRNRAKVLAGIPRATLLFGVGYSFDEYPFASSLEGGSPTVSVAPVPFYENLIQGGIISASYYLERITPYSKFEVVVIP